MTTTVKNNTISTMSAQAQAAFPKADFVVAVQLPSTHAGVPEVTVYAGKGLTPKTTNLAGMNMIAKNNGTEHQLLPAANEMLETTLPDGSMLRCVNRPVWMWMSLSFTKL